MFSAKMIKIKIQKCSIFDVSLLMNLCKSDFTNVTIEGTIEISNLDSNRIHSNSAWHKKWFL